MPTVRSGEDKWKRRSTQAVTDYKQGVQRPRVAWHEATRDAAANYTAGVQEAIANDRYAKAATPEASQRQQQRAATIGADRYVPGIQQSGDAYRRGFEPYRRTIESTELPPRGPKGSAENYQRSAAMGQALNDAKKQLRGG